MRPKFFSYLTDNNNENEKANGTKKMCYNKKKLNLKIINIV